MPILAILALMWVASLSSCVSHEAEAFATADDGRVYKGERIDLYSVKDEVKDYLCSRVDCPDHFTVDELKLNGSQFAAVKASFHFYF
jgi:hypothetical protein